MAESAIQFVIQKLNDFLTKEAYFLQGVDERVRSLRTKLEWIHALLKDVDGKRRENERVKLWVAQIREVAYDAEDVIDSYIFNAEEQRGETSSAGLMSYLPNFARGITDLPTIHDVGKKIGDIERRLDEISSNRSQYGIDNIPACGEASSSSNQSQNWREKRAPIVEEVDVVGVEDETETLVRLLIEGEERRAVISITGMGGIGKTTLAKKVYNSIHVKKSFDCHAWVYVSQEYRTRELLVSIINCFTSLSVSWDTPEKDLQRKLSKYLKGKRYLVAIDDIWTRDAWDSLVSAFPDGKRGSRVLLTTRNDDIAKYADALSTPHKIRFLNESESWALFCKKALPGNLTPLCPPNLEELGRKIFVKCGGLPLAIAVLGGILSRKEKSVNTWDKVLQSVEWWLNESEDQISGLLALSYRDLPYYLKPCFLYFGAFPQDSEIHVQELILRWVAEGFVQLRGEEEAEDVAEDYLEELSNRSMIQVVRRKSNGTVETCCVHDLLHDLAISKAKEEKFMDVYGNILPRSPTKARRLAITSGDINKSISLNRSTLHIRSLFCSSDEERVAGEKPQLKEPQLKILWGAFKLLRVLDIQHIHVQSLPDEIGYLIHLRYLSLKGTRLTGLPSTITRLSNLQTLHLPDLRSNMLLDDTWKMEQIQHLVFSHCRISNRMPLHLSNLRTLSRVEAGSWIEDGLEKLTNLRELGIEGDLKIALSRSLCKLVGLRSLYLKANWRSSIPAFQSFSNHQHLYKMTLIGTLEKLPDLHEFPPNLTELCLNQSELKQHPMRTLEKLPNLRILTLQNQPTGPTATGNMCSLDHSLHMENEICSYMEKEICSYMEKEMVCSVGGFPWLEVLSFKYVDFEEWRVEGESMPNLRCLEINSCYGLKMLPDGLRHLTTLQELKLLYMPKEFEARAKKNEGEDWFKIRHVPSIITQNFGSEIDFWYDSSSDTNSDFEYF